MHGLGPLAMAENINKIKTEPDKPRRGVGSGSNFFAVRPDTVEALFAAETGNRLNLVACYLVLAAGTGADHRLTKWSAKACEDHAGVGTPRAKRAIEDLVRAGIVEMTDTSTRTFPQYRLPEIPRDHDPIFLPVQLVTGFGGGTSILRRVRESGDPMLLRMLIDLYALVQVDCTHGVPIKHLRTVADGRAARAFEMGIHNVWALKQGTAKAAAGAWCSPHRLAAKAQRDEWSVFWERLGTLEKVGALWFEQWAFESDDLDAEPLMPVDFSYQYDHADRDEATDLCEAVYDSVAALAGERQYLLERDADFFLPLTAHQQAPALIGVARLRIEPDTPGRRRAYAKRMTLIERQMAAYRRLAADARSGEFDRPLGRALAEREG